MVSLDQKLKCVKTCEKHIYKHTRVVLWIKNRWKKHQIFEKWDDFKNRPSCKGYSPCKYYGLCKMVSLGQKVKFVKTCENHIYKHTRLVLWKKLLEKTPNIREMRPFFKIGHIAKAIAPCKSYSLLEYLVFFLWLVGSKVWLNWEGIKIALDFNDVSKWTVSVKN